MIASLRGLFYAEESWKSCSTQAGKYMYISLLTRKHYLYAKTRNNPHLLIFFFLCFYSIRSKLCFPRVQYEACIIHTFPVLGKIRCITVSSPKIRHIKK